jgi:hypothetical protein
MVMIRRCVVALAAGLSLGGCCHDGFGYSVSRSSALAQFVPRPKTHHHVKRAKNEIATTSMVTSKVISLDEDELSKSDDDQLKRKLVICRGCERPSADSQTISIWPEVKANSYSLTADEVSRLLPGHPVLSGGSR